MGCSHRSEETKGPKCPSYREAEDHHGDRYIDPDQPQELEDRIMLTSKGREGREDRSPAWENRIRICGLEKHAGEV